MLKDTIYADSINVLKAANPEKINYNVTLKSEMKPLPSLNTIIRKT